MLGNKVFRNHNQISSIAHLNNKNGGMYVRKGGSSEEPAGMGGSSEEPVGMGGSK